MSRVAPPIPEGIEVENIGMKIFEKHGMFNSPKDVVWCGMHSRYADPPVENYVHCGQNLHRTHSRGET